jgi:hypothetical protein
MINMKPYGIEMYSRKFRKNVFHTAPKKNHVAWGQNVTSD